MRKLRPKERLEKAAQQRQPAGLMDAYGGDQAGVKSGKIIRINKVTVTPEQAAKWLNECNTHNRALSNKFVEVYTRMMKLGQWRYTYDPIIFDNTGILLNGQHRLWACVYAEVPFEGDLIFGADRELQDYIDDPRKRTVADQAHLRGVSNSVRSCALASMLLGWKTRGPSGLNYGSCYRPTKPELLKEVETNHKLDEVTTIAGKMPRSICTPTIAGTCYYLFSEQNLEKANQFFEGLRTGADLTSEDPVYLLRERLQKNTANTKSKLSTQQIVALFFNAWNAYKKGISLQRLRGWPAGAPFPSIE